MDDTLVHVLCLLLCGAWHVVVDNDCENDACRACLHAQVWRVLASLVGPVLTLPMLLLQWTSQQLLPIVL